MIKDEMTSLEIAELTGKKHKHINEAIKKLNSRCNKKYPYKESSYVDKSNRNQTLFIVSRGFAEVLITRCIHNGHIASSLEKEYLQAIQSLLPNLDIEQQVSYCGGKYIVDALCDGHIIIEIDEDYHKYTKEADAEKDRVVVLEQARILADEEPNPNMIMTNPNRYVKVFRIREGFFHEDVNLLLKYALDNDLLYHYL